MNDGYKNWINELWPSATEPRDAEELFDVINDPDEFVNLAKDPGHRQVREELGARLDRWMKETDDPLLKGPIPDMLNSWPGDEWQKHQERVGAQT